MSVYLMIESIHGFRNFSQLLYVGMTIVYFMMFYDDQIGVGCDGNVAGVVDGFTPRLRT